MADLRVEVVEITDVMKHENADRLDIAKVYGYDVVVGRSQYKPGDCAVYFPVDSILPQSLSEIIFAGSVMSPVKRVRAARIRGCVSQGLLVGINTIQRYFALGNQGTAPYMVLGDDLTEKLNVTKQDPEANKPGLLQTNLAKKAKRGTHPLFKKYYSIQHLLKYNECFDLADTVFITEKIHGTNFRAGWLPTVARTWVDKLRVRVGAWVSKKREYQAVIAGSFEPVRQLMLNVADSLALPKYTFVFGTHNVELKSNQYTTYYEEGGRKLPNVYEQCVIANDLPNKIKPGEIWYGEIYGPGIQKGYGYGLDRGEFDVRFFDIFDWNSNSYLSFLDMAHRVVTERLRHVPFWPSFFRMENILRDLNQGGGMRSCLDDRTRAEGVVIRSYDEQPYLGSGRKVMKLIADNYLLKKQSEFK